MTSKEWEEWWQIQPWKKLDYESAMMKIIADLAEKESELIVTRTAIENLNLHIVAVEKERDERLAEMNLQARWTNEWRARAEKAESTLSRLREGFEKLAHEYERYQVSRLIRAIFEEPKESRP